jgi:hypothetical protein
VAVLIDRPPQIVTFRMDWKEHLIQVPLVARLGMPPRELIGIRLAKLAAPLPNGFVGPCDAVCKQQLFNIAITEAETEIEPDRVADSLRREAMILV